MINLQILVPESTTNYVKNPSFEVDTTGWATYGGLDTEIFEDNFNRPNGSLGVPWDTTNNAWTISSSKAITTPTEGVELLTDGGFEAWTTATNLTNWTETLAGTSTLTQDAANQRTGLYAVRATGDGVNSAWTLTQSIVAAAGSWLKHSVWAKMVTGVNAAFVISEAAATLSSARTINAAYSQHVHTKRIDVANPQRSLRRSAFTSLAAAFDDYSVKALTVSDLFATINTANIADISASVTIGTGAVVAQGAGVGLVGWLDSYTSPGNFVICYLQGTNVNTTQITLVVEKCVGGVYTGLISTIITYVAGAQIRMTGTRSGSNLLIDAFYNGTQVGVQQTISDAGIISNTRHGIFSVNENNTVDDFRLVSTYTRNSLATLSRSLDRARFGRASGKIVTNGDMLNEGVFYKVSWLNGVSDVLTASVYARGGGKIRLRLADATTGMNFISKSIALNDERWTRLEVTGRCSGGNDVRLWAESDNPVAMSQTFYVDGAQIERKSAATSYCDGDQPGCRWNVVANATLSTRTADTREGGRWVPLAGPCRPNNDLYVTTLGGFGMPPIVNNIQSWANAPGSFFQNEKIQNRVATFSFHVKKESFRTGGSAPSILALHELRQQLINLFKSDVTLNSQAFLFEYSDSETDKKLYIRMRYEAGLEGEWDIRNRWFNSFPVRMIAVDPLWSEDNQDVMPLVIKDTYSGAIAARWARLTGQWQRIADSADVWLQSSTFSMVQAPDGAVYMGETSAAPTTRRVSKWDGSTIISVGAADGTVQKLIIGHDSALYAVGEFTTIGGVAANRVAKYTPSTGVWSALGSGLNGAGRAICVGANGNIYVGGEFTTAGGVSCLYIARWDGLQWRTVGATSGFSDDVHALASGNDGRTIYAGGAFTTSNGGSATYNRVASIDTETNLISPMGYGIGDLLVLAMTVGLDGSVYAAGNFTVSGAPSADALLRIAKWSGGQIWEPLGDGLSSTNTANIEVRVLATGSNGEIYAGGRFDLSGTKEISNISKWYGGNWLPLEFPERINVLSITIFAIIPLENGDLYTGGTFSNTQYEFPKLTTITNNGTASCWPILTVTGAGTLRYISNVKTGQEIFLELPVFSGETVTIDFARGKIESDTRGDLNYTLLSGSEIRSIYLLPGENTISVLMNDDVNASMQLRWEPLDWSADAIIEADDL